MLFWEIGLVLTILLLIPPQSQQPSTSSALGYQPPTPSQTVAFSSPFSVPTAVKALSTLMKLDSSSRPRGPLTEAEKQFRKQRGVCNYCGTDTLGTACAKLTQRDAVRAERFFPPKVMKCRYFPLWRHLVRSPQKKKKNTSVENSFNCPYRITGLPEPSPLRRTQYSLTSRYFRRQISHTSGGAYWLICFHRASKECEKETRQSVESNAASRARGFSSLGDNSSLMHGRRRGRVEVDEKSLVWKPKKQQGANP